MGMDLGVYTKISEKRYDFVPGVEGLRAGQQVRKILNNVLAVDFSKADEECYSWSSKELDSAITTLEAKASYHIIDCGGDRQTYKEVLDLFRLCQNKGYTLSLI